MKRGTVKTIVGKIGVGKESDIYKCTDEKGQYVVLKLARLGRVSFKTIKNNRDYLQYRTNYNWLYLSRLASIKEFSFMSILYEVN
jgi:RIO kinase 2